MLCFEANIKVLIEALSESSSAEDSISTRSIFWKFSNFDTQFSFVLRSISVNEVNIIQFVGIHTTEGFLKIKTFLIQLHEELKRFSRV